MPLNQLVPQTSSTAQTMIHGSSDSQICAVVYFFGAVTGFAGMVEAESSCVRSAGEVQITFGRHTFRKPMRHAIEISDAPMSTIHGLTKFEIRNCGMANDTPVTRIAGQMSF